ncbi:MAG: MFS transporter [Gammaproteobacteria bacterium]|nr:MFS transporter [Gammaproteobacteria bacterium]MCH9763165.1 MFS transporter [Gammaproteobacteria bacterium]
MPLKSKRTLIIGWVICGIGAVFYSYEYLLRITPSVMEPALREHFSLSATGFGIFSAFYYYAYVPMQLPVGILMDRWGPRRLLTLACALSVLGIWIFAGTSVVSFATAGRFLTGFGSAFAFVGVLKLATIWLPEDKLAMVAGLAAALGTIGAMVGDNLLGAMVLKLGWQKAVHLVALFGLFVIVLMWFGLHDKKNHIEDDGGTVTSFKDGLKDLKYILTNRQIWINGAFGCLIYLPTTVFAELWGIPYLSHARGMSLPEAEFANSLVFLGFMFGAPTWGYLSDRLHQRKKPMFFGALGAAIMMTLVLYLPDVKSHTLYFMMFVLGLFYSVQAVVFAVGRELSPKEAAGTAIATTNMFVMLGAMLLQPLIGSLLDHSVVSRYGDSLSSVYLNVDGMRELYTVGDYQFAMVVMPIGIFLAAILALFLKETHAHARCNLDKS